jgi:hypothetical protein
VVKLVDVIGIRIGIGGIIIFWEDGVWEDWNENRQCVVVVVVWLETGGVGCAVLVGRWTSERSGEWTR